jgi:FAD/FMN-containing dehydrogenase
MGVDQILGAKIVNASGEIQDADEDMLIGIRGGGASLGIIVELTIKVYPLDTVRLFPILKASANDLGSIIDHNL